VTREEEIFEQALDFDSDEERRAYLAGACDGDQELATAVAELLAASGDADRDDFLQSALGNEAPIREEEGSIIGRYKLLQKIGEGGFGVVYMAEQREPVKRRVALKIIKLGMDTKHVVGRFEAERQALAMMDHPNIANVLDAGATEQGRPYFVMELVRGVPVTQFCDEKKLSTEERLILFKDICSAVQHAHQKGIIHRDLKPNNVIVTAGNRGDRAHPKVIDFGIAKATQQELTDKTLFTRFEDFVGTPAYMSPEQAQYSQLDIDTRTDIYSLGVLLYELLTGKTPFDSEDLISSGLEEIRRRIREDEPPKPSTRLYSLEQADRTMIAKTRGADPELLQKKLSNEIDWIIMKAIDKDRSRRYGTAEALAYDIENYLSDSPVEACPPTAVYRFKKMIRRNKRAVVLIGAVMAALAVGAAVSTWQAVKTARANERREILLRDSYLVQARATRKTAEPGRHHNSIAALAKAAAISPSVEQRTEAIAVMALPDMRYTQPLDLDLPGLPHKFGVVDADGERYAIGTPDGEITIYSYDDQSELMKLPKQNRAVKNLLFSPNGKYLAIHLMKRGPDLIVLWDLDANKSVLSVESAQWKSTTFDDSSKQIAIGLRNRKAIAVYDLKTAQMAVEIPLGRVPTRLSFDQTGKRLAAISGNTEIAIFDVVTGERQQTLTHLRNAKSLAWHPDGETIAMGATGFGIVVFDVESGVPAEWLRGHLGEVVELEFHPDGRFLASASWDGTSRIWDYRSGRCILQTHGYFEQFLRNGKGLQMALHKMNPGIWAFTTSSEAITHFALKGKSHHKLVNLSFSPSSLWLAGTAEEFAMWDLRTKEKLIDADIPGVRELKFEANGRTVLMGGYQIGLRRYQLESGLGDGLLQLDQGKALLKEAVNRFALSPDDHTIYAIMGESRQIAVLDAATGLKRRTLESQIGPRSLEIDSTGRWMASGSWHGVGIRIWDLHGLTAPPINLLEMESSTRVFFGPNGNELFASDAKGFHRFETGSWKEAAPIPGMPSGIDFHPSKPLVAICLDGRRISLLRFPDLELIAKFEPLNPGRLTKLLFSPDGQQLAMATSSRDITVWNLPKLRQELAEIDLDWE